MKKAKLIIHYTEGVIDIAVDDPESRWAAAKKAGTNGVFIPMKEDGWGMVRYDDIQRFIPAHSIQFIDVITEEVKS